MKSLFKRMLAVMLMAVTILVTVTPSMVIADAASGKSEYDIYKVTASANLRESPSIEGKWIMVVPAGKYVAFIDDGDNSYYHVKYGDYEGYIYVYCVVEDEAKTFDDYIAQFPDLAAKYENEEEIGKADTTSYLGFVSGGNSATSLSSAGGDGADQSMSVPDSNIVRTGVVTTRAKFRTAPSVTSDELNALPVGAEVEILEAAENGFLHVSYDGQDGFVYARLVDYDEEAIKSGVLDTVVVDDINNLNTKSTASGEGGDTAGVFTSSLTSQRRTVAASASAALTGETVTTATATASTVASATASGEVEIETAETRAIIDTSDTVSDLAEKAITSTVALRSLPDEDSNKIQNIPAGSTVTVLGSTQGGYTMVQYNGVVGYIVENTVTDHVNTAKVAAGTPVLYTITAYCSCRICCGAYSPEVTGRESHTATGTVPAEGRTIAVDPSVIPYGTSVYIDGYGVYIAEDCGGAVKGNHIDMYFESHQAAVQFGVQRLYVTILE